MFFWKVRKDVAERGKDLVRVATEGERMLDSSKVGLEEKRKKNSVALSLGDSTEEKRKRCCC